MFNKNNLLIENNIICICFEMAGWQDSTHRQASVLLTLVPSLQKWGELCQECGIKSLPNQTCRLSRMRFPYQIGWLTTTASGAVVQQDAGGNCAAVGQRQRKRNVCSDADKEKERLQCGGASKGLWLVKGESWLIWWREWAHISCEGKERIRQDHEFEAGGWRGECCWCLSPTGWTLVRKERGIL